MNINCIFVNLYSVYVFYIANFKYTMYLLLFKRQAFNAGCHRSQVSTSAFIINKTEAVVYIKTKILMLIK